MASSTTEIVLPTLGSPFTTPRSNRTFRELMDAVSPPVSTPRRRIPTPRGVRQSSPGMTHGSRRSRGPKTDPSDTDALGAHPRPSSTMSESASLTDVGSSGDAAPTPAVGLSDLPVELLQQIHMLADNPKLPQTSKYIRHSLSSASATYIATFMLYRYRDENHGGVLTRALQCPIVDLGVAEEIRRIWDRRRGYVRPSKVRRRHASGGSSFDLGDDPESAPTTPRITGPALEVLEWPRRLFRPRPAPGQEAIHPLIRYLKDKYDVPVDSFRGYALARSVLNQNYDLVQYLLEHGADPNRREHFALNIAIEKKDLRMVKLLVETHTAQAPDPSARGKKRRLSDRVPIDSAVVKLAMARGTPEIVQYFVHEKGAMPPLNDIMALGR